MGNIRSQLFKGVQPPDPSIGLGNSHRRSNDGDDKRDGTCISTENSHESDSVNSFSDSDELFVVVTDHALPSYYESSSLYKNVFCDNEFVMVSNDDLNDYVLVESFVFVPNPSFESNTML